MPPRRRNPDYPNEYLTDEHISRLGNIRKYMIDFWAKGAPLDPLFTLHGQQHSEQVELIIGHILAPERREHHLVSDILKPEQLFYLLASVWLHDVGMIVPLSDDEKLAAEKQGVSEADWARQEYHKRSYKYVISHAYDLNLQDLEPIYIGQVCQAHRKGDLFDLSRDYPNIRLLGALIRVADELDISKARMPPQLMELPGKQLDETSRWHWVKHWCIVRANPEHLVSEDKPWPSLLLTYDFIVRLPSHRYKTLFLDRILGPIREVVERQNVDLILREKHLGIDLDYFKFSIQIDPGPLPDGTDFNECLQTLLTPSSEKVIAGIARLQTKDPTVAKLLQRQCQKLANLPPALSDDIETTLYAALNRYLSALEAAGDLLTLESARNTFEDVVRLCFGETLTAEMSTTMREWLNLANMGWRLMGIVIGQEAEKKLHLTYLLNSSEANDVASWIVGQQNFSPEMRQLALSFIARKGADQFYNTIYEATKDEDPSIRAEAVKALKRFPGPGIYERLGQILDADVDGKVRQMAAAVLGELVNPSVVLQQEFAGCKVLLVDDEDYITPPLVDALGRLSIEVKVQTKGEVKVQTAALQLLLQDWKPDVVVCELANTNGPMTLPATDDFNNLPGLQLARIVRQTLGSHIHLIATSEIDPEKIETQLADIGGFYVHKPATVDTFVRNIKLLLLSGSPTLRASRITIKGKIDFAIITIREDEFRAVLKRFPHEESVEGNRRYAISHVEAFDSKHYTVAIGRTPEQGQGASQDMARDMIEDLDPHWLLLVGIAGGVPEYEFTLGDVVAANRLLDFCIEAAIENRGSEYGVGGGPMHKDVQVFLAHLPAEEKKLRDWNTEEAIGMPRPPVRLGPKYFYGDNEWRHGVKEKLSKHFGRSAPPRLPQFTTGAIASSDRLIKSSAVLKTWRSVARQIQAVEMELAGVYQAARRREREYPILAIRGISDIVGYRRDPDWTKYACNSAASFAYALVRAGLIDPRVK
jgi:nucleoside phosphorylase/DNA-binding NarL/FixJ family response regulator